MTSDKLPLTNIYFFCYRYRDPDSGEYTIFKFYPNGVWDEGKYTLEEAIAVYPVSKYEWVHFNEEAETPVEGGGLEAEGEYLSRQFDTWWQ